MARGALDTFASNDRFRLHGMNGRQIHRLLARMTDYVETQSGQASRHSEYVQRGRKGYEIEHIWANHPQDHTDEFCTSERIPGVPPRRPCDGDGGAARTCQPSSQSPCTPVRGANPFVCTPFTSSSTWRTRAGRKDRPPCSQIGCGWLRPHIGATRAYPERFAGGAIMASVPQDRDAPEVPATS
jgi:hypothetical protein